MKLSPRELKVLTLVALGYSDKEIGVQMKISYGTVRSHIDRLVLKLNARNRANAVFSYMRNNHNWLKEI
ncbi:MAG: helix-turn-helix transcriptional regulator [Heliobacteriaceae bacterium]|jgi:DNA-binding NarL/FixJ family response regulator|nr:helix-turn-helix transcriptional regulator [Heliobacteriaceae bacterium]